MHFLPIDRRFKPFSPEEGKLAPQLPSDDPAGAAAVRRGFFLIIEIPARKEKIAQGTRGKSISYSDLFRFVFGMKGQKRDKYQIPS